MRKYVTKLNWSNTLSNKTAIECWNILIYVIEGIIDIIEDCTNHKEARNAAMNEII